MPKAEKNMSDRMKTKQAAAGLYATVFESRRFVDGLPPEQKRRWLQLILRDLTPDQRREAKFLRHIVAVIPVGLEGIVVLPMNSSLTKLGNRIT